jgi:tripartite-type tricarboxylate transporter receptor subunit TctC
MAIAATARALGTAAALGLILAEAAHAQSADPFFARKTITISIGYTAGGSYDLYGRLVARHIGKHIPGNPLVVPQNMTGAGGIKMANFLFTQAARDGTNIGMLGNNFPATQAVGAQGVQYDAVKFNWLGTIAPVVETMAVWHTAGVKTVEDLRQKEIVAGASGKGAITYIYPSMMNEYLGTRFKIVTGYPGGNQINLAMERNEVQARNNTWSSWKATKPSWLRDKLITVIVQAGPRARRRAGSGGRGAWLRRARVQCWRGWGRGRATFRNRAWGRRNGRRPRWRRGAPPGCSRFQPRPSCR